VRCKEEIAFEIARSQLSSQKEDLRNIRNQAGLAGATSGLIATVFASLLDFESFRAGSQIWFAGIPLQFWLVLVPFVGSVVFLVRAVAGWKDCTFDLNPIWVINHQDDATPPNNLLKELTKDADKFFDGNEQVISDARSNLWWSMVLGTSQIPAWLVIIF